MDKYEKQITNEELQEKIENDEQQIVILDVRETEEYAIQHIPGSVLIPLGQLEERCDELSKESVIYIICRSGNRSNQACHILHDNGFEHIYNVIPGMMGWMGPTESDFSS